MNTMNERGFTILEAMVALVVFSIGLISLYMAQTATIGFNSSSDRMSTAANWGASTLERMMLLDKEDISTRDDGGLNRFLRESSQQIPAALAEADGSVVSPDGRYTMLWYVVKNTPIYDADTIYAVVRSEGLGSKGDRVYMSYVKMAAR